MIGFPADNQIPLNLNKNMARANPLMSPSIPPAQGKPADLAFFLSRAQP